MELDPELVQRIAQEVASKLTQAQTPSALLVREIWDLWAPVFSRRPDRAVCQTHRWYILELPFELDGKLVTLGEMRWDACTSIVIDTWRRAMEVSKDRRFKLSKLDKTLSPAYRNRVLNTAQSMFTWALDRNPPLVRWNPLSRAEREDESDSEREGWFTEEQFKQFVAHAHPLLKHMATVAYRAGGMRNTEVRTLRKQDVDWENDFIIIRSSRHKNKRMKRIPITEDVKKILRAQAALSPSQYLFPNPRDPGGGPIPIATFAEWVRKARRASGVDLLGEAPVFHHMRHSFGMHMLMKGANPLHVMDVLGVTSPRVARRYMKLSGEAFEVMRDKMNERWTGRQPPATGPPDGHDKEGK